MSEAGGGAAARAGGGCPRCGEATAAGLRYCPRCGQPLAAPAPPAETAPRSEPAREGRREGAGLEASLPLLTGGATILATGAGLRGELPGIGLALILGGVLLMLAPLLSLGRSLSGPDRSRWVALSGRTVGLAAAALVGGLVLGGVVAGLVWPRVRAEGPVSAVTALSCDQLTAGAVVERLQAAGLPVEATAPDEAAAGDGLQAPPGLADAAAFRDTRLPAPPVVGDRLPNQDARAGGVIEVFADAADAEAREVAALPRLADAELRYRQGPVLLRLSGRLSEGQTDGYAEALAAAVACDA